MQRVISENVYILFTSSAELLYLRNGRKKHNKSYVYIILKSNILVMVYSHSFICILDRQMRCLYFVYICLYLFILLIYLAAGLLCGNVFFSYRILLYIIC